MKIKSSDIVSISSGQVTGALGFTPYSATNPSGFISSVTSGMVTAALGFTPYNATNPSNYVDQAGARSAISSTTLGYNSSTGVVSLSSGNVTTALGFTPVHTVTNVPTWTTYTPTIGSQTGTIGTTTIIQAKYLQMGTIVFLKIQFSITSIGTASGYLTASVPATLLPAGTNVLFGREIAVNGKSVEMTPTNAVAAAAITYYDNTSPIAAGVNFVIQGFYETSASAVPVVSTVT